MALEKRYYTVDTPETFNLLLQHINESSVLAYDLETNSLNVRKGRIIGIALSGEEGVGFYFPVEKWDKEAEQLVECQIGGKPAHTVATKLLRLLKGKQLVAHNFSFDGRFTKNFYGIDLLEDLWVDTALLVHTVQEEGAFGYGSPFALKSIAIMNQEVLGLDVKEAANQEQIELKESIKENGGTTTKLAFEIYKADLEILSKYAAADADLTLRICNLYLKKLEEEGLTKFFFEEEVMPLYKEVTIPMEDLGIMLDLSLLEQTKEELEIELEENKKTVIKSLLDTKEGREWVVEKAMTEFPPSNKGTWAQEWVRKQQLPLPISETGRYTLNRKSIEKLEESPTREFLLTGNIELLDEKEVIHHSLALWRDANEGQYVNIQSKLHLGEIIFDKMGIKPLSTTKTGRDQFDMEMIDELSKKYTWAENLRVYNKLLKIKSTYVDRFLDAHEDGIFYPYFKQNGTVSGRYGSDLQQLPKPKEEDQDVPLIVKYNNRVRAFFISRPDHVFVDTDYQSLEPRIFASVTGDEGLQAIFEQGWDFYSTIAIQTEKLEGVSPDPKAPNALKTVDPVKRNKAKAYSLGIPYGMEAFALGKTLSISTKEANKLVEGYINGFPGLRQWRDQSREFVKENGYITNKVGRVRHLPKAKEIYDAFQDRILDWRFRKEIETHFGRENANSVYRDYKIALNSSMNFQIQSYAASTVNRAALAINRAFREEGIEGRVVAQIHDQLVAEVPEAWGKRAAEIIQDKMENVTKLDGVKLVAIPEISRNMQEGHG